MVVMIGISADFDPVHLGHVELIKKGKEIAKDTGDKVVIYLNKDFSANHAPFFIPFEARKKMALAAGADKVVGIEGLHHRLTLAYSVPIRIAMMIEDGVVDYVDAANVSPPKIMKHAQKFVNEGIFVGIPRNLPNRNVIRWFAVNEFLKNKYGKNMKFHIIPELEFDGKISGRILRRSILENDMIIPEEVKELLPKTSTKILEKEIKKGTIPGERNWKNITKRMNTCSRPNLMKIAYLNGNVINEIIKGRVYRDEESVWATFRRGGYGPVLTRLAISCIEKEVTREEVVNLMRSYEKKGVTPHEQSVDKVIERSYYVATQSEKGEQASIANEKFRNTPKISVNAPLKIEAGLYLTKFETKIMKRNLNKSLNPQIYIDKDGKISCEIKLEKKKIKTNLKLPGKDVTYIRYILDSQFIPVSAKLIETKRGIRVEISVHDS
ncbi:MAG: cytidyltransferase [Methanobrevibacter sp.]|nr:cytidyltransferase [Methanobrevibacter sp.]